ncbi:hypothetical protein [Virgibacillus sp. Bac330]|uniref:hypothetical protein n=1 Tax=Virgibacillus sp. Bac330 TaxID=2419841 RepID=UPI000EF556AE|nr:hypothetical protein [Virgibacillus sp. Bac330]
MVLEKIKSEYIFGDKSQVHRRLQALQLAYQADEMMILTNTPDYVSRKTSYQLIAQTCLT